MAPVWEASSGHTLQSEPMFTQILAHAVASGQCDDFTSSNPADFVPAQSCTHLSFSPVTLFLL